MAGKKQKQYAKGEAANYVTRKQAMSKLQLTLKDFRRLCILKGIHPREPRNRRRAQKGDSSKVMTLYHEKDIRFLMHEPIVWKFRDFKVYLRKLKSARDKGDWDRVQRLKQTKPSYTLDHIVKERYPSFVDALGDLEDCMCLVTLFANYAHSSSKLTSHVIALCRQLSLDFLRLVADRRCLRKVFISIKGFYFQAEIYGQTVNWIAPHQFVFEQPADVDVRLMGLFVEFYTTLLGFVNFRLYADAKLALPEYKSEVEECDRIEMLNTPIASTCASDVNETQMDVDDITDLEETKSIREHEAEVRRFTSLFKDCIFFLQREVPNEPFIFMIRSFGGTVFYQSADEHKSIITHQICDRPRTSVDMRHAPQRLYIQPQWIADCINRRQLIGTHPYMVGETLPPHLSPFMAESVRHDESRQIGRYVPPEEAELLTREELDKINDVSGTIKPAERTTKVKAAKAADSSSDESGEDDGVPDSNADSVMTVNRPVSVIEDVNEGHVEDSQSERMRLQSMMVAKKHRRLYKSMMTSRRKRIAEAESLAAKRSRLCESSA